MNRHGHDLRIAARELLRVEDVRELALAVAVPFCRRYAVLGAFELVKGDAGLRVHHMTFAREGDHARIAGLLQQRQQVLDQQRVTEVVRAELELVAVGREGGWQRHDAGIADQDVELLLLLDELAGGVTDVCEGREITGDECDGGVWGGGFAGLDGAFCRVCIAAGEVDVGWIVGGEELDGTLAETGGAFGYSEHGVVLNARPLRAGNSLTSCH